MSTFGNWARLGKWTGISAFMAITLHGCGGGGGAAGGDGSGGTGGSSSPARNTALKLDTTNFSAVSAQGLRTAETTAKIAQHASLAVQYVAHSGALQTDLRCANGTAHFTLIDADGNGVPSAGDTVKVDYARCNLPYFGDIDYSGTITIKLTAVDAANDGAVAGSIDFGAGLVSLNGGLTTWFGTMNFRRTATSLQERVEASASVADDLRRSVKATTASGTAVQIEAYQHPQVVRLLQRDTARVSIGGTVSLASDSLGGRLDMTIDPPLSAFLDTHADTGSVRIDGASASRITLRANASGSSAMQADLDANGDGTTDTTGTREWNELFTGYAFSEESIGYVGSLASRSDSSLRLIRAPDFVQLRGASVTAPLRLQFDRPLVAGTVLYAQLVDHGAMQDTQYGIGGDALSDAWPIVAADVEIDGAAALVRPRSALRYGHLYQLLISTIGDFVHAQAVTMRSAIGTGSVNLNVQVAFFNTDDILWVPVKGAGNRSMVMPGNVTTVSATAPFATGLPLQYQWTQVSGPALVIASPATAATTVRLADGSAPGIAIAELQLAVTDAIGRVSYTQVQMQVANLTAATRQIYFSSPAGEFIGAGQTRAYTEQTGSFFIDTSRGFLNIQYSEPAGAAFLSFNVADATGNLPAVGTYTGAVSFGSVASRPQMDFSGTGRSCQSTSSFQVLDIAVDGANNLQRLAVDFEQTCTQSNPPNLTLHGSIRINSSVAVTP